MPAEKKESEEEAKIRQWGMKLMKPEHEWSQAASSQQQALINLAEVKNPAVIPYLIKALHATEHSEVTWKAAYALGRLQHHALPALTEILESKDENTKVKQEAIHALAHMRYRKAFPVLLKTLQQSDPEVRVRAALVLGGEGRTQAIPHLAKLIREDPDHHVIQGAAEALGTIGSAGAIKPLTEAVNGYFDPGIAQAALSSMGKIGDPQALPLLLQRMTHNMKKPEDISRHWTVNFGTRDEAAKAVYKILERASRRKAGGKISRDENVKKLLPVHEHIREEDEPAVKAQAYAAALEGKVNEKNARLYLKQLRALEGKLK